MKWFYNLKVSSKLLGGFILVALIAGFVGYMGITNIKTIDKSDTELYENMTIPLAQMGDISTYFQRVRINTREILLVKTPEEKKVINEKIKTYRDSIDAIAKRFEAKILSKEMQSLFDEFSKTRIEYGKDLDKLRSYVEQNKTAEAVDLIQGEMMISSRAEWMLF